MVSALQAVLPDDEALARVCQERGCGFSDLQQVMILIRNAATWIFLWTSFRSVLIF